MTKKSIQSLAALKRLAGERNVVLIEKDTSVSMRRVSVDGHPIMHGNYWDFHPGCHGGWFYTLAKRNFDFMSEKGLAEILQKELILAGSKDCAIEERPYSYKEWEASFNTVPVSSQGAA